MSNLIQRISDGRTDLIIDHCESGHDIDYTDQYGTSLIKIAAYYGDVSAIKYLLLHGEKLESLGANFDLNGAAFHGHWRLVQYLLEHGADPNRKLAESGETPLHSALSKSNNRNTLPVIQVLIDFGANPDVQTNERAETGGFMRDAWTSGETPLHRAAAFANAQVIECLLGAGADKSAQDAQGNTPISWASWHLRPGKILALLAHGAHRIHPLHEERMISDHGFGYGGGIMSGLVGKPHLKEGRESKLPGDLK